MKHQRNETRILSSWDLKVYCMVESGWTLWQNKELRDIWLHPKTQIERLKLQMYGKIKINRSHEIHSYPTDILNE